MDRNAETYNHRNTIILNEIVRKAMQNKTLHNNSRFSPLHQVHQSYNFSHLYEHFFLLPKHPQLLLDKKEIIIPQK